MKYNPLVLSLLLYVLSIHNGVTLNKDELFEGTWDGVEVMGGNDQQASLVRTLIPIKIGASFSPDKDNLKLWCEAVKKKIDSSISCSIIGYIEGKYYFNVEILPRDAKKDRFRKIPMNSKNITVPTSLSILYSSWEQKLTDLMKQGAVPKQFYKDGYLQCSDHELQLIAKDLAKKTPQYTDVLLDILRYSHDFEERIKAATLISWSKHPDDVVIVIIKENLLNDSSAGVRNELTRSFSYLINDVSNQKILKKAISALCEQLNLPYHSDRTKALAALIALSQNNVNLAPFMSCECKDTLSYIAARSILPNVGGGGLLKKFWQV
ncbi:MAG: hypothetical protein U1E78_07070 [Gammaproteobacteria bacterium]